MNRRTLTHALLSLTLLCSMGLSGCGFELRRPPQMAFKSIQLTGFAGNSPLAAELARTLEDAGVSVVDSSAAAAAVTAASGTQRSNALAEHVVLQSLSDNREQSVASTTAFGQVRDLSLRTRFKFKLTRADGSTLIEPTELLLTNDLPYNEKDALAKMDETQAMHKSMQTDIVSQVMRRLAVIRTESLTPAPR